MLIVTRKTIEESQVRIEIAESDWRDCVKTLHLAYPIKGFEPVEGRQ